jgi:hypothetical protein
MLVRRRRMGRGWQAIGPAVGAARPAGGGPSCGLVSAAPSKHILSDLGERQGDAKSTESNLRSPRSEAQVGRAPRRVCDELNSG